MVSLSGLALGRTRPVGATPKGSPRRGWRIAAGGGASAFVGVEFNPGNFWSSLALYGEVAAIIGGKAGLSFGNVGTGNTTTSSAGVEVRGTAGIGPLQARVPLMTTGDAMNPQARSWPWKPFGECWCRA